MGAPARHLRCPHLLQRLGALQQGSSALHQIIDDYTVFPFGIALFHLDEPLLSFSNLIADDGVKVVELSLESFVSAIIWVDNGKCFTWAILEDFLQVVLQDPHCRLKFHKDGVAEVELLLQGMDVVDHISHRSAWSHGTVGEHSRQGGRGGNLPESLDALHRARAEPWQNHSEVPRPHLGQRIEQSELLKDHRRRVEADEQACTVEHL
mmetsp:Transcript_33385/g.73000  ORF Transcript_33385/g.73000 Transcript_33385/m.73000 type:complete len:208 (+) Transcript_33385:248-871(+)